MTEKVRDTFMGVGPETLSAARVYYHSVKGAAKADVPGAETIAEELGKRKKTRRMKNKMGISSIKHLQRCFVCLLASSPCLGACKRANVS
jgi:hypothetical protein